MSASPEYREAAPERIVELDGLRGVAVMMVLAWHYLGATIDPSLGPWALAMARVLILGRTGVDLFFVMSGFLITGIILDRSRPIGAFLTVFYLRRSLRILPPYLLLVVAFWSIVWAGANNSAFNADTPLWRHLTFTQNFWMAEHQRWGADAISVTWSVAIEEHYYLLAAPLLLSMPRHRIPGTLLLLAAASIIGRALVYVSPTSAFLAYVATPFRLDGLALGGLVAWAWRAPLARQWLHDHRRKLLQAILFATLATPALAVVVARDLAWHMHHWGHAYLAAYYSAVLVAVLLVRGSAWVRPLRSKALHFAGRISYSAYLFHPFMLSSGFILLGRTEHIRDGADVFVVLTALAATIAYCAASHKWMEKHLIAFGRRFSY